MSNIHLPGEEKLLAQRVLAALEGARAGGLSRQQLEERFADSPAGRLADALAELEASGQAVEWTRRWLAVRHTEWTAGTIELLEGGDALVRTGAGGEPGYFVARRHLKGAEDRDAVLIKRLKGRPHPTADWRLPEAAVVKILATRWKRLVGTLEPREGHVGLLPFDAKVELEVEVRDAADVPPGDWVVVELDPPSGRAARRRGRVVERLGPIAQPGVDVLVLLRHHDIPEPFAAAALAAAEGLPENPTPADWAGRQDLRQREIVTIDGESARDFDDAVEVEEAADGSFRLGVHIADVSHYVREGTPLDLEAYRRGTSVYYPERAIPMLPEALSNGLCSLRPQVPRLAMSVHLEIGPDGSVRSRRFAESVIRSARRLTYAEVRRVIEEPRPEDAAEYGSLREHFGRMARLMAVLHRARDARGSIDFDLEEGDVVLDTDGNTVGVLPGERNVAHRIIEEFMIAANEAVALELDTRDCPALHRTHDAPTLERLEALRALLRELGYELTGDLENLHPAALQAVLRAVAGKPEEGFVSALVLRSMLRAFYSPEARGHYALAARHYTHFTSPIRRYPDLLVHRRLRALLRGTAEREAAASLLVERLPVIAEHCSATERRAEQSERELLQWKKVRFLAPRRGERFWGRITGVQPYGLFVQLEDWSVDGLVSVRTMSDDFYRCELESHRLVGAHQGREFRLGGRVEVVLLGVEERRRGLDLRLADMPEPAATTRWLGRPMADGERPSAGRRPARRPERGPRRPGPRRRGR